MPGVLSVEWFGRVVGAVGIVEVHPHKKRFCPTATGVVCFEPGEHMVYCLPGTALDVTRVPRFILVWIKLVVVGFKTTVQSPRRVQHKGADESRGCVSVALESLSKQANAGAQRRAGEITHA